VIAWLCIFGAFLLGPTLLLGSAVLTALILKWWAFLVIPVGLLVYFVNQGESMKATAGLFNLSWGFGISVVVLLTDPPWNRLASGLTVAFIASLWAVRFRYVAAPRFLRTLILRNERAFHFLREYIEIRAA
jgi:hypothetical protein